MRLASSVLNWKLSALPAAHDPGLSTAVVKILPDSIGAEATFARADIEALVTA